MPSSPTIRLGKLSEFREQRENANKHTPRGMDLLDDAMTEDGYVAPMTATADGEVIDGSARHEKAAEKFPDEAIIVEHDGSRPIVMQRTDIESAEDIRAKRISARANRIPQLNLDFSPPILQAWSEQFDIGALWNKEEFSTALAEWNGGANGVPVEDVEPQIDKAEELRKKWGVESGQLWQLGEHRLLCGDSTKREDVERVMGGEKAQLCHADPPYGMGKEAEGIINDNLYAAKLDQFQMQWWKACRPSLHDNASAYIWGNAEDLWRLWYVGGLKDSERLTFRNEITWDKREDNPTMFVSGVPLEARRMYHPTERCLFFMLGEQGFNTNADNYWDGWEPIRKYLDEERRALGWTTKHVADWFGFHPRMADHWFSQSQWSFPLKEQYERLQREARGDAFKRDYDAFKRDYDDLKRDYDDLKRDFYATRAYFDNTHDNMTDVWDFPRVTGDDRHGHATPKPVVMLSRILLSSAEKGAVVYEPFLGSGSTLIACEQTNRKCRALEISPGYVAVTLQRWADATGKEPKLLE